MTALKLSELNQYVPVQVINSVDLSTLGKSFAAVVITEMPLDTQLQWNEACREQDVAFISTQVRGLFG